MLLQPACLGFQSSISMSGTGSLPFYCLVTNQFQLGGHVFGKRPHDLSGSTQCLRYPLPSSACIPQPPLILSCSPAPQLSLCLSPWRPCPEWSVTISLLKSFLLLSNKDGAKSHPKLTPHRVFPQYFTENTKQKCHSTRGVFFLRM